MNYMLLKILIKYRFRQKTIKDYAVSSIVAHANLIFPFTFDHLKAELLKNPFNNRINKRNSI